MVWPRSSSACPRLDGALTDEIAHAVAFIGMLAACGIDAGCARGIERLDQPGGREPPEATSAITKEAKDRLDAVAAAVILCITDRHAR